MFEYSQIPDEFQNKLINRDHGKYIKVFYNDPNPILGDCKPEPCVLSERYPEFAEAIRDFEVRRDDVFVIGHAKTGTTVTTELVSILINNLDFEKVKKEPLLKRAPYLELHALVKYIPDFTATAQDIPTSHRRLIKSHLPVNLLPSDLLSRDDAPKMIYVARNPKDSAVSWYHHFKNLHGYEGSLNELLDCYVTGNSVYGSHFQHMDEYIRLTRIKKNILLITYEDVVEKPVEVVRQVAEFLEMSLTQEEIEKVAEFIHFDRMKERSNSNFHEMMDFNSQLEPGNTRDYTFLRKGKKGSHEKEMPKKYIAMFNEEMKKWKELMTLYPEC